MGQDLLARQAPIDRKMKAVDSVALNRLIMNEMLESPAADLMKIGKTNMLTALPNFPTRSV